MKKGIGLLLILFVVSILVGCLQNNLKILKDTAVIGSGGEDEEEGEICLNQNLISQDYSIKPYVSVYQTQKFFLEDFKSTTIQTQNINILPKYTELIFKVSPKCIVDGESLGSFSQEYLKNLSVFDYQRPKDEDFFLWTSDKSVELSKLEDLVNADSCILGVAPNSKLELLSTNSSPAPNDTFYEKQKNLSFIQHDKVYKKFLDYIEEEVVVAVIDTGSNQDHPDMKNRHWRNQIELQGVPNVDDDANGFVDDIYGYSWACYVGGDKPFTAYIRPHGDHVSGIIAANIDNNTGISGVAGQASKIMHLNVFYTGDISNPCDGTETDINLAIRAVRYAADNGAKVINLSLGKMGRSSMMEDALKYATSKGVFVAAASGNNNRFLRDTSYDFFYPCGYARDIEGMSCIGAVDATKTGKRCGFSNYSTEFVDLSAPGCDTSVPEQSYNYGLYGLLSTVRTSDDPIYRYMAGTSMAAPHIAGAAALVIGYVKTKIGEFPSPSYVKKILQDGSRKMQELDELFLDGNTLDLKVLLEHLESLYPPDEC